MVPPDSDRAPPTPPYSGFRLGSRTFRVRGCHPLRPAFPGKFRYTPFFLDAGPTTPGAPRRPRFGLAPFRSPLLGGSLLFSFPPATWMFRFAGFASALRRMPCLRTAGFPIRASADPWLLAPPRGISLPAAPFIAPGSLRHPPCALSRSLAAGLKRPRPSAPSHTWAAHAARALVSPACCLPRRLSCLAFLAFFFSPILSMNRPRLSAALSGECGDRSHDPRLAKQVL